MIGLASYFRTARMFRCWLSAPHNKPRDPLGVEDSQETHVLHSLSQEESWSPCRPLLDAYQKQWANQISAREVLREW